MPIDEFILGPMIGPYENMIKDVDSKGITSEHVDELKKSFARMQDLGQEHSDITAFMGICMQEDLFSKLGDLYSKALTSHASEGASDPTKYDDAALLKQSVDALKQAIETIRQGKFDALKEASKDPKADFTSQAAFAKRFGSQQGLDTSGEDFETAITADIDKQLAERPNAFNNVAEVEALDNSEDIIKPIEDLIALGEQGDITYPDFLRLQIEQGLDKAMEGSATTRKGLVYSLEWAEANKISPHHIDKCKKHIAVFDQLSNEQKFGVPNSKELKWATNDVDYEFEPDIIKWGNITDRWNTILDELHQWSLAYCSHAPYKDPWRMLVEPHKSREIKKSKDTLSGIIKQRERLLEKYYGITFQDIFTHETFLWAVETNNIHYSKEFVEFLKDKVYPTCIPLEHMPNELISERERLSKENREINPKILEPAERVRAHYDRKFGEGRYVSKFGAIESVESNAAPWS